jgi:hypothetical protein
MLDENKHIDSLFADGLKGMSVDPNPEVWNAISNKMAAARRKRRGVIIFISTALAASVLLFFGIANRSLFTSDPGSLQLEQLSDTHTSSGKPILKDNLADSDFTASEVAVAKEVAKDLIAETTPYPANKSADQFNPTKENHFQKESVVNSILLGIEQLYNPKRSIPESLQNQYAEKSQPIQLTTDEIIVMNNLLAMEQAKKEALSKNRWAIIGQLSSAYSNEESAASANSGIVSFGGGVKINYALGEKLALQTGLMYNRIGQDFGGSDQNLVFSDVNALEDDPNDSFNTIRKVLPTNTTAGNINYKGSDLQEANKAEFLAASAYGSSEELMQSFEIIEVPFLLRYNLSQNRLGIYINGGVGANWIVANGVYRNSGSRQKIGEIDNLRTTNFSSLFGLGIEYQLSPKIRIGLEPSFKYYLNSINKSSEFDYKPYSIGINTGIRYSF